MPTYMQHTLCIPLLHLIGQPTPRVGFFKTALRKLFYHIHELIVHLVFTLNYI
jgi:hypothetical protein